MTAGYGRAPIVQDVALRVGAGAVVAVVGPNGAGKSTLFKAIFGLLRASAGRVELAGRDISHLPTHRLATAGLAYVPQVSNIFPSLSVVENLEMGAYPARGEIGGRITAVLDLFPDLRIAARRRAGTLSGGQRNMLGVARALMLQPQVLLLDEPTAGLSPAYTATVWEQVRRIAASGTAVAVVEQNVDLALRHSDWAYVLVAGRNRLDGPSPELAGADLPSIFLGRGEEARAATPGLG